MYSMIYIPNMSRSHMTSFSSGESRQQLLDTIHSRNSIISLRLYFQRVASLSTEQNDCKSADSKLFNFFAPSFKRQSAESLVVEESTVCRTALFGTTLSSLIPFNKHIPTVTSNARQSFGRPPFYFPSTTRQTIDSMP